MSEEEEAEEVPAPNKLWLEAMNARMRKMMLPMFEELKKEFIKEFSKPPVRPDRDKTGSVRERNRSGRDGVGTRQCKQSSDQEKPREDQRKLGYDRVKVGSSRDREGSGQNRVDKKTSNQDRLADKYYAHSEQRRNKPSGQLQNQQLKKQKEYDEINRRVQEAFEAFEGNQKKRRTTHQSVDTTTNNERPMGLEKQKSAQDQPLSTHMELIDISGTEQAKAKEGDKMELELYTSSQGIECKQSGQPEAEVFSNLLCSTQVNLVYESIQYLNNILCTRSFKQSGKFGCVLNVENASILHLIVPLSAKEETGSMNECNSHDRTTAMRSLTMDQTEQSTHLVQEPILMQFPCDYPRKHCKEIDLIGNEPNLFVIVSAEEEKRFGLENVKEFRVPCSVFDKMIPSFETFTPEMISKQMGVQIDEFREFSSSLSVSVCSNIFDMFRTEIECAMFRTWPEFVCLFKNMLIEPRKLNVDDHVFKLNHLNSLYNKSMFYHLERLFFCSCHTFDVFSLVFVKEQERQVKKNSRAKKIQVLSNQVDYGPSQLTSFPFGFWSWKYLRKETPNRGSRTVFRCTRREDDQRFKPPDLSQIRHLNLRLFILIKEEPPDARSIRKTKSCKFGGKFSIRSEFISTNLLYVYADNSDLRSNPFQVGGDDMRMDEQHESERTRARTRGVGADKRTNHAIKGEVTPEGHWHVAKAGREQP